VKLMSFQCRAKSSSLAFAVDSLGPDDDSLAIALPLAVAWLEFFGADEF